MKRDHDTPFATLNTLRKLKVKLLIKTTKLLFFLTLKSCLFLSFGLLIAKVSSSASVKKSFVSD